MKWVLISGASSGIGEATARLLASQGFSLWLLARRRDRLLRLSKELKQFGGIEVKYDRLDVSSARSVETWARLNRKALANVDVLINNAGLALGMEVIDQTPRADSDAMIDTNLKGLLALSRAVIPVMRERGTGHIVNLGSVAGFYTYPKGAVYCATKAAVRSITEAMRMDLLGSGVRVTEVSPGMVESEFSQIRFKGDRKRAQSVYHGMKPLTPHDIAEIISWSLQRPAHVNIQEIIVYPTDQASPTQVSRK